MANGKLVNTVNSVHHRSYTADDLLRRSRRVVAILGVALAWKRLRRGFLELLSRVYKNRDAVVVVFLPPLFFPSPPPQLR